MDRYALRVKPHRQAMGVVNGFAPQKGRMACGNRQLLLSGTRLITIMRGTRLALMVHACIVAAFADVSAFAQTNIAQVPGTDAVRYVALREYIADQAMPDGPLSVPSNIVAPQSHRTLMQRMLRGSAMFRRQCQRIANRSDLLVRVVLTNAGSPWTRARTNITREPDGMLVATVEVRAREDHVELIAHEFEHIIEQLDGIDLPSRSRLGSTGVSRATADPNAFETERAKRVGVMVSMEVRRSV
jgi:hypothetical protein